MNKSFESFKKKYKGNVFIIFSIKGEIEHKESIIQEISDEIERLVNLNKSK